MINDNLGKTLFDLRKKSSFSQTQVAEELGITRQTLSKWETGKSRPDAISIKKISEIYKTPVDDILNACDMDTSNHSKDVSHQAQHKRNHLVLLFCIIDIILCIILVSISRPMLFWVLNFNLILFLIVFTVRVVSFLKAKMN